MIANIAGLFCKEQAIFDNLYNVDSEFSKYKITSIYMQLLARIAYVWLPHNKPGLVHALHLVASSIPLVLSTKFWYLWNHIKFYVG